MVGTRSVLDQIRPPGVNGGNEVRFRSDTPTRRGPRETGAVPIVGKRTPTSVDPFRAQKRTNAGRPLRRSSRPQVWGRHQPLRSAERPPVAGGWTPEPAPPSGIREPPRHALIAPEPALYPAGQGSGFGRTVNQRMTSWPLAIAPSPASRTTETTPRLGRACLPRPVPLRAIWPPALGSPVATVGVGRRARYAPCSPNPIYLCVDCSSSVSTARQPRHSAITFRATASRSSPRRLALKLRRARQRPPARTWFCSMPTFPADGGR